ncbi:MAG TPA: hypothetical protein VMB25_23475 [Bryobacteraceae bacterium]|nr:hypothetical protein [Bryobacteraceae bacterium]
MDENSTERNQKLKDQIKRVLLWAWSAIISRIPNWIVVALDWLVSAVERTVVLAVAFVIFYSGWLAFRGGGQQSDTLNRILKALSDNWKGLLLLLIPLFYRPIRAFLARVTRIGGLEAEPEPSEEKRTVADNRGE